MFMLNYALIITLVFTLFADSPSAALKIKDTGRRVGYVKLS